MGNIKILYLIKGLRLRPNLVPYIELYRLPLEA